MQMDYPDACRPRAEHPHDSPAAQLVRGGHHRHRRCRRRVRLGVVDCRGLYGRDAGIGLSRSRACDAQRSRQRDDERPQRLRCRCHQAGARHQADGQAPLAAAELMVIIDLPKRATPMLRPTCRCAASAPKAFRCASEFSMSKAHVQVRHQRSDRGRGAKGQFVNLTSATRSSPDRIAGMS